MLQRLLSLPAHPAETLEAWWTATQAQRDADTTADRALLGGAAADRLGFAFAAGYHEALRALTRDPSIGSLCVTEARGNAPKDIETTLVAQGERFEITGTKTWATGAPRAEALLVAAKVGVDAQGRNMLRMVRVPRTAPGVRLVASTIPFVPEIPHAEVHLDHVAVHADAILPGDGYTEYVKPFRTVEDIHVHCAVLGYLIGVARRHALGHDLVERLVAAALSVRALASEDPKAAATHVALAGAIALSGELVTDVERAWKADDPESQRWQRDRALLRVAGAARAARRERAWAELSSH